MAGLERPEARPQDDRGAHKGDRDGGMLTAGLFLQEFVGEGIPWAHIDIAGPADSAEVDGELVKGGTGFGVRTLVELLSSWSKPKAAEA